MNKISKELLKIAREIKALDDEYDGAGIWHDQRAMHDKYEQDRLDIAQREGKKYILHHKDGDLWRIRACKNFRDVKKGEFGGLIDSEKNLSHDGNCWVFDSAEVTVGGRVCDDAVVANNAWVDSVVCNNARVYGNAQVYDGAIVCDNAQVYGNAQVFNDTKVCGNAQVYGRASIQGWGKVSDNAQVYDNACVYDFAKISGKSKIHGKAQVNYNVKDQEITE